MLYSTPARLKNKEKVEARPPLFLYSLLQDIFI